MTKPTPISDETHIFEYRYRGAVYILHMIAGSEQEATERIKAAARQGVYLGVLAGSIPADEPTYLAPNNLKTWQGGIGMTQPPHPSTLLGAGEHVWSEERGRRG